MQQGWRELEIYDTPCKGARERASVRACACVCVCVRVCLRACVCVSAYMRGWVGACAHLHLFVPAACVDECMSTVAMFKTSTHEKDRNMPKNSQKRDTDTEN